MLPLQQRPHDEVVEREVDALQEKCRGKGQRAGVVALALGANVAATANRALAA